MPSQVKGSGLSVITATEGVKVLPQTSVIVGNVKVSVVLEMQFTEDAPSSGITSRVVILIVIVCVTFIELLQSSVTL